jgi:cysteine-rich repeat protein
MLALVAGACGRTPLDIPEPESLDPRCGDGVVDVGEMCDDRNSISTDACLTACVFARCGDGIVHAGVEACDDNNSVPGDGCTNDCALPSCGNGILEAGEVCDDGNGIDTDACPSRCLPAICGDGFVHAGFEECDGGVLNADRPAFLLIQGELVRPITPVERADSVSSFYNYFSASAHTGFEDGGASNLFLYRDVGPGGQLGLVTIHGADDNQPQSDVQQTMTGLPEGTFIAVTDDPNNKGEFSLSGSTTAVGDWSFDNNSDGGALSGLPSPAAWIIEVTSQFSPGISKWDYVDGSGERIALFMNMPAKIISLDIPSECRIDCTKPRCGDGILDAGEVCDDGNTSSGDGCAANCLTTN